MRWKRIFLLTLAAALVGGGAWFLKVRMERGQPAVSYAEEPRFIGRQTAWSFTAEDPKSGLRQLRVWIRQGTEMAVAYSEDLPSGGLLSGGGQKRRDVTVTLDPKALGLADGAATLIVAAQDNSLWGFKGNSTFLELPVTVDTKPPGINLISTVHNVAKGGSGLVVFRVTETAKKAGVETGGVFYPAYPEAAGGPGAYVSFFAVAHDAEQGTTFTLVAEDEAGNGSKRPFPVRIMEKGFPRDAMNVSDGFLARKVPEFQAADPTLSTDLLKAYLTVNSDWRQRDHERLRQLCSSSEGERLWSGPFLQMPNTQNMAPYAVRRTYIHDGKKVDYQVHLGLDLASTAGAPVPAANGGVVKMAGDLGIYGLTVVIDHGQGLFSLYAHLSGLAVTEGESVGRGQTVGSSGQTGMAGGDHLHFSILVSGEFVNPIEWLDEHWIADNVENKLDLFAASPAP